MNKLTTFLFVFFILFNLQAQDNKTILLKGKMSNVNGIIEFVPFYAKGFYDGIEFENQTTIENGNFTFKIDFLDNLYYPFEFIINDTIKTNIFYLNNEDITLVIDSLFNVTNSNMSKVQQDIENDRLFLENEMKESKAIFKKEMDSLIKTFKGQKPTKENLDYIAILRAQNLNDLNVSLESLIEGNSKSQFAFWKLIALFIGNGYSKINEESYYKLDITLKNSRTGKYYLEQMGKAKELIIGKSFPNMVLEDENFVKKEISFNKQMLDKKFVLVDFWFGNCKACIAEYNILQPIYKEYKPLGFEIVGISVEKTDSKGYWIEKIKKHQLNWVNYLDGNGVYAKIYGIGKYPTNFLLDENGIIIKKDITSKELDLFLTENLK
jgi:thiol-disulfide isomerase/thioredoxin